MLCPQAMSLFQKLYLTPFPPVSIVVIQSLSPVQLCMPMDCSTPGFPVLHYLLEFAQTHVLNQWRHPTISSSVTPFSSCLQSFPASGSFPMSLLFASGGQIIGASVSASVLPMNIQGWFPLDPGFLPLLSKNTQGSSPEPQFKRINSLALSLLYGPALTTTYDY